jgi:hypothetical protein
LSCFAAEPTLQLPTDDHLANSINAMHLKDRLRDIEIDCRNRLHAWLLVGAFSRLRFDGTRVPVEEPSTASKADIALGRRHVRFTPKSGHQSG